jgi:hypothetical protein
MRLSNVNSCEAWQRRGNLWIGTWIIKMEVICHLEEKDMNNLSFEGSFAGYGLSQFKFA